MKLGLLVAVVVIAMLLFVRRSRGPEAPTAAARRAPVETADIMRRAFEPEAQPGGASSIRGFYVQSIGGLHLPTGSIVACDGFVVADVPFTRRVAAGEYPVDLAIARFDNDERVAFARLRFAADEIVAWEMAARPGEDAKTLALDAIFGYGVDSGTGGFMDVAIAKQIERLTAADTEFSEQLMAAMEATYKHTRSWALVRVDPGNVALFSSGHGDGFYASYWGLNRAGAPVVLVTDFGVIEWK